MRTAIVTVVCLAILAAIIQHGSACILTLDKVRLGCIAFRFVPTPRRLNVCGQNRPSCQTNRVGIVDGSVRVQDFEVLGQCKIYGPLGYQQYMSPNPMFYGEMRGVRVELTGKQRDINGQEGDFKATVYAYTRGIINAKIDAKQCVEELSSSLMSIPYGQKFQGILSESRKTLFNQLKGALGEVVDEVIRSVPSMFT